MVLAARILTRFTDAMLPTNTVGTNCPDLWVNVTATYLEPNLAHRVHIAGATTPCCGANFIYHIRYRNQGTAPVAGATIEFQHPRRCSIVSITSPCIPPVGYSAFVPNTAGSCEPPFFPSSGRETFTLPTLNPGDNCAIAVKVHLCCNITESCAS